MRIEYQVIGPAHPDLFDGISPIRDVREVDLHSWLVRLTFPAGARDDEPAVEFITVAAESRVEARRMVRWLFRQNHTAPLPYRSMRVEGVLPEEPDEASIEAWKAMKDEEARRGRIE